MWRRTGGRAPRVNSIFLRPLKLRVSVFSVILAVYLIICLGAKFTGVRHARGRPEGEAATESRKQSNGRSILVFSNPNDTASTDANCTDPAIQDFPPDLFTESERRNGAVFLHAFLAFYLFTLLATVCDNYFVPAIGNIAKSLRVPKDVAGATFMAAATSSPELFINSVGTFVTEGDIGIGTIVGSGVFNILAVPACCGLFAGKCLSLDWWPLTRDSAVYSISVILLFLSLNDGKVSWQEAFCLVASYAVYILIMSFSETMNKSLKNCRNRLVARNSGEAQLLVEECSRNTGHVPGDQHNDSDGGSVDLCHEDEDSEELDLWNWPSNKEFTSKCWWILVWPISFLFYLTIPDCRKPSNHQLYPLTFAMCIFYIGSASYLVAWMITVIGDTARIPDSVMGLTFLAAGTSLPEAVSSVIVAHKGYGNMGLSNSIGSNTFDILLCLGLPWLIKSALNPTIPGQNFVLINSQGIRYTAISLLSAICILYLLFVYNKFKLDRKVGFFFLITYIIFLVVATLNELNVFQTVNHPTCGW